MKVNDLDEHNVLHILKIFKYQYLEIPGQKQPQWEARWRCATKNEPSQTYLREMLLKDLSCLFSNDGKMTAAVQSAKGQFFE